MAYYPKGLQELNNDNLYLLFDKDIEDKRQDSIEFSENEKIFDNLDNLEIVEDVIYDEGDGTWIYHSLILRDKTNNSFWHNVYLFDPRSMEIKFDFNKDSSIFTQVFPFMKTIVAYSSNIDSKEDIKEKLMN